jgi:hypothetical protein
MVLQAVLLLFFGLVSMGCAQGSAENLARVQEGMGEESLPKNSNNKTSAFATKMFESKEIQIKRYEGGQSELKQQLYASAGNSDYNTRHLQALKESPYSVQRNEWSESNRSELDGVMQADLEDRKASAFQKKSEIQMNDLTSKEGPNWVTRRSPQYHQKNGDLRMYEGRLVRVREKVSREEDLMRRDLGVGNQEIFNPDEVQKMLKPKNMRNELQTISPLDQQVKVESESAFQPAVVDSSLDSP